jgi:hypothetical protein
MPRDEAVSDKTVRAHHRVVANTRNASIRMNAWLPSDALPVSIRSQGAAANEL